MTLADYRATKEYRDSLESTLRRAAQRLCLSDYAALSRGILAEIGRIDKELAASSVAPEHAIAAVAITWTYVRSAVRAPMVMRRSPSISYGQGTNVAAPTGPTIKDGVVVSGLARADASFS